MNTDVFDSDLNPVLCQASNEELSVLHDILMEKFHEELSTSDAYQAYHPDHRRYADLIAKEIRDFGGNSFRNVARGFEGPPYKEIVCDVARKLKVPFSKEQDIEVIEQSILATVLAKLVEEMTDEEKTELLADLRRSNRSWVAGASAIAFQQLFRQRGFASYQFALKIFNAAAKAAFNHGLSLPANALLVKLLKFSTGPIGVGVAVAWTLKGLADPSYRVTIPTVVHIAMLRARQASVQCGSCDAVVHESIAFCPECGSPLAGTAERKESPPARDETDPEITPDNPDENGTGSALIPVVATAAAMALFGALP